MRGRPKKVKALSVVAGGRKLAIKCPKELCPKAVCEWKRVVGELSAAGTIENVDLAVLAGYCEAYAEFILSIDELKSTGPTTITEKGNWIQHPLVSIKNSASERMLKYAVRLGLCPSARAGIDDKDDSAANPLLKIVENMKAARNA